MGDSVFYIPYGEAFAVTGYVSLLATGGFGHTVSFDKPAYPSGEITVPFIEVRNAGVLQDVVQNYPQFGATLTSGNVTTTGPATLVAYWWGDGGIKEMTAVPNNGFIVIESFLHLPDNSGVQAAVAARQVDVAHLQCHMDRCSGTGAVLWLFAFQSGGETDDQIFIATFD